MPPADTSVTDRAGNPLSSYNDPGLATVANLLMQAAPDHKGNPGLSVQFQDASGGAVSGSQTTVIAPTASRVAMTIGPQAEQAALNAVNGTGCSAIVVIQPSTGHILAIAVRVCANVVAGFLAWLVLNENPAWAGGGGHCSPRFVGCGGRLAASRRTLVSVRAVAFTS